LTLGRLLATLAALVLAQGATAQSRRVIDLRSAPQPSAETFEARWADWRRAEQAKDSAKAALAEREIARLRVVRNVESLELVALPLVGRGLARLRAGDRVRAEEDFRSALALDPRLPDAWFGLARAQSARGVLGQIPALRSRVVGLGEFLGSWRGRDALLLLGLPVLALAWQALAFAFAGALVFRHGGLLRHDVEELLGARGHQLAWGLSAALLLLPALLGQGWGFLALWVLALLFAYMTSLERGCSLLLALALLALGPGATYLTFAAHAVGDPLRRAALMAVESGPDDVAEGRLAEARARSPRDRTLVHLLARLQRKAGRDEQAAALLRAQIAQQPDDGVALVNLGNVEFGKEDYRAAIARYKQVVEGGTASTPLAATAAYNLSLAYLEVFDRQRSDEARVHADRLASAHIADHEQRWKSERRNEVVDVGPVADDVRAGLPSSGLRLPEWPELLLSGLANRLSAATLLFALVAGIVHWRRGTRMFTLRCLKCGTPFCRHCHLGKVVGGLCTQCYHLFVVRDGVSGPARNQKLIEVQAEETRRERVFRMLSLVSPGAGHVYARRTLVGALLTFLWYGLVIVALLAGRVIPITQAPAGLVGYLHLVVLLLALAAVYTIANRARPDFEAAVLARQPRRGRV
jgi:tetratricopeptide (TPR) repeat protein